MQKTFILGLGAQRCGTTWLHHFLCQDKTFSRGFVKEYHIWDAIDIPILHQNRVRKKLIMSGKQRKRYLMQSDEKRYFDYFSSLYSDEIRITSDITPSYSGLGRQRLEKIRDGFEERGIECKVVFLVRDPIERCKSAVHFNLKKGYFQEGVTRGNRAMLEFG